MEQIKFTTATLRAALVDKIHESRDLYGEAYVEDDHREQVSCCSEANVDVVESFGEAGLLTGNEGIVLELDDGTEFQISIVQSR